MNIFQELEILRNQLAEHLDENAAIYNKERELRAKIRQVSREVYKAEMLPVMYALEKDIAQGKFAGEELERKQAKLELIKGAVDQ